MGHTGRVDVLFYVEGLVQLHGRAGARRFVGGEDDAQAVDRVAHMIGQIQILGDRFLEIALLAGADFVVVGYIGEVDELVDLGEGALRRECAAVDLERLGFGV